MKIRNSPIHVNVSLRKTTIPLANTTTGIKLAEIENNFQHSNSDFASQGKRHSWKVSSLLGLASTPV